MIIFDYYELTYVLLGISFLLAFSQIFPFFRKTRDFFEPINLSSLYFLILFFIRPIYDLLGYSWFITIHDIRYGDFLKYFNFSLLLVIIGYIFFLLSYYSIFSFAIVNSIKSYKFNFSTKKLILAFPFLFLMLIILFIIKIKMVGGFSYYLSHKQEILTKGGLGYIDNVIFFYHFIFIIYLIKYYKKELSVFFPIVLFISLFTIDILSGSKGKVIMIIIYFIIIRHYFFKRFSYKFIIFFILIVLIVFPIFNEWRNRENFSINDVLEIFENSNLNFWVTILFSRFHAFDAFVYIVHYTPDILPFQWGQTFLPWLVSWIPRSLWPDKPLISFGKEFGETYFAYWYKGTGSAASPSIFGMGYINFNIAGVILFLTIAGIFLRVIYLYMRKNNSELMYALYAYFFVYMINFWERDLTFLISIFYNLLLILLFFLFLNQKSKTNKGYK